MDVRKGKMYNATGSRQVHEYFEQRRASTPFYVPFAFARVQVDVQLADAQRDGDLCKLIVQKLIERWYRAQVQFDG